MARIRNIAAVCKSKDAGPFELTIDVVFDDPALFDKVKRTGALGPSLFARLYGVRAEDVLFTVYDAALAFKATSPRLVPAGDIADTDVYVAQQHGPPLAVEIPSCKRSPALSSRSPPLRAARAL